MRSFEIEQSTEATLTAHAGLALVGRALAQRTSLAQRLASIPLHHGVAHADCVRSYIGLLATGKSDFIAIENVSGDCFFTEALGLGQVPPESTLRQRFDEQAKRFLPIIDDVSIEFLQRSAVPITPMTIKLGNRRAGFTTHAFVPLDIDVFPMDNSRTKKEGVAWTYKKHDGYAPIAAYLGAEGWCLAAELRQGNQHSQFEFVHFLERVIPRARAVTDKGLLARLDSAHDALENRAWLLDYRVDFIMKWNPRQKHAVAWLAIAEGLSDRFVAPWTTPRPGKRVRVFSEWIDETFGGQTRRMRRVMRVTERTIDKKGNALLVPDITVEGWWVSLGDVLLSDEQAIELYCQHGTSEQFHSEFKTDLDLERLPSGKFATNDLVLAQAVLVYNILRWIGQTGLIGANSPVRHPAKRRRLRTVMQEMIFVAARVVESGRRLKLKFATYCPVFPCFATVYRALGAG